MSFNIGDKVRVTYELSEASKNLDGQVCTISSRVSNPNTSFASVSLEEDAQGGGVYVRELELVTSKYKAGDTVRFTETLGGYATIADTGVVVSFDPETPNQHEGYTVECRRPGVDGWTNLFFFEDEIEGLVEEEPLADWERELLEEPFLKEGVVYAPKDGPFVGLEYRLADGIVEVRNPTSSYEPYREWSPSGIPNIAEDITRESFTAVGGEVPAQEEPFAREGVIYRRTGGSLRGVEFRLKGGVLENRTPPHHDEWTPSAGWYNDGDFNAENFEVVEPEDTRSSTQSDPRSEMNRKMDTVREAGERRRQKLIAHTRKLEAVIRDRNAEIEFLREKLAITHQGVIRANDAIYEASFDFIKPSKFINIPV